MRKLFLLLLSIGLFACGNQSTYDENMHSMVGDMEPVAAEEVELSGNEFKEASERSDYTVTLEENASPKKILASADYSTDSKGEQQTDASEKPKKDQKIIRTANMNMEVDEYKKARLEIDKIIEQFDAQIQSEAEERSTYRIQNNFVIRVSPEKLDNLIEAVTVISIDVDSKSVNSRNVTAQYVDLETRLASKRAVIKRYRDILTKAKTIKDILNVEEHLRRVVEEVESMEGKLRVLRNQVGKSTLNLRIYESFETPSVKKRGFWNRVGRALSNGWRGGQETLIGLISIWPFWILLGGLVWLGRRAWRKRKKK